MQKNFLQRKNAINNLNQLIKQIEQFTEFDNKLSLLGYLTQLKDFITFKLGNPSSDFDIYFTVKELAVSVKIKHLYTSSSMVVIIKQLNGKYNALNHRLIPQYFTLEQIFKK